MRAVEQRVLQSAVQALHKKQRRRWNVRGTEKGRGEEEKEITKSRNPDV